MPDHESFAGRRALITGGARRLGRETALALGALGCDVAVHFNSSMAPAEELCGELRSMGVGAEAVGGDLSDPGRVETVFQDAWRAMGHLDFLVNNASVYPPGRLDEMSLPDLHENLHINAWAPFLLTRAFWRKLRGTREHGAVVNLLDTRLVGGDLAHAAYHLSKAVLRELTIMTALEFAPNLRVNGVAPGAVLAPEGKGDSHLERLAAALPLKRRGFPGDVAKATVFLLGASFVTGQVIFVDGGRHIRLGGEA